ncbi:hypothetical protein [Ruania halotolerans]|uniref:hypothetical protein n=1 Tax=Ruania halotolerans TaxID=2897773 RepID=UPI001E373841|nr:hypothetical protein [Ruania halotolerans]UFU06735.1 hypothetical protein LQF10_01060 [Ruania halotolerans]
MSMPDQARDVSLNVSRSTGPTVFQVQPARLVWTADDRIQVIDTSPLGDLQVVLDVRPQEITKATYMPNVGGAQSYLTLQTATGKVKVDLGGAHPTPHQWESVEQYNQRVMQEGMPPERWWTDRLGTYGVQTKRWGFGKIFGLTLLILVGVIAVITVIAGLAGAF